MRLSWDIPEYETGVDRAVFYPPVGPGEAWNGFISLTETPSESEERVAYIDGVKTNRHRLFSEFGGTIDAVNYPPSFFSDILMQKRPVTFGLSYRVMEENSYKIHIVYNVLLAPSAFLRAQNEVSEFSWDFTTLPIDVPFSRKSAHLIVDSDVAYSWVVEAIEDVIYGTDGVDALLPDPADLIDIFEAGAILRVTDNGDGSFTVDGPDSAIIMTDATTFEITWPSAIFIDADSYTISSL